MSFPQNFSRSKLIFVPELVYQASLVVETFMAICAIHIDKFMERAVYANERSAEAKKGRGFSGFHG